MWTGLINKCYAVLILIGILEVVFSPIIYFEKFFPANNTERGKEKARIPLQEKGFIVNKTSIPLAQEE